MPLKRMSVFGALVVSGAVSGQNIEILTYTGRVIEVRDPSGLFGDVAPGQEASGSIVVDLDTDSTRVFDAVEEGAPNLGIFALPEFGASIANENFDGEDVNLIIGNGLTIGLPGNFLASQIVDGIILQSSLDREGFNGSLSASFFGPTDLFDDGTVLNTITDIEFDRLESAEVTISFSSLPGVPEPASGSVRIEVLGLASAGGTASLSFDPLTFARLSDVDQSGVVDLRDFTAFLERFAVRDFLADQDLDGAVTVADFSTFLANFAAGR